jgi:ribose 5-phosphate isomerase
MIGKILLGLTLTTVVVMKDGMIEVNVQEKHEGGSHVHLYVPATVATWGVHLAPRERLREQLRGQGENLAIARMALRELEKAPDALLVEVESSKEHVHVATRNGNFVVDVNDASDTVHVSLPIRAARKVVEDLQADAPTS